MHSLHDRMRLADRLLAPYAVKHATGLGREHPEDPDLTRFPFQRDRDRILHAQSFRRLKQKTQVFVAGHGDHYRTRITHTLEVAQISRDIARTLALNEDLAEAIALAHDLGHTPFGHAGEEAMDACMRPFGKRFEHNDQSLRVVTLLEQRSTHCPGLNLSREVLEGLQKHRTPHDDPTHDPSTRSPSLEAQIVNLADEIAYTAHDADDGVRAGQFSRDDVCRTRLGQLASGKAMARGTEFRGTIVDALVTDLYDTSCAAIGDHAIRRLDDVYAATTPLIAFSPSMRSQLDELRAYLWNHLYLSAPVQEQANFGKKVIIDLFAVYVKSPPQKVLELQRKTGGSIDEAVKDYIAGMTDPFALSLHRELTHSA
jgi:dGTPase